MILSFLSAHLPINGTRLFLDYDSSEIQSCGVKDVGKKLFI